MTNRLAEGTGIGSVDLGDAAPAVDLLPGAFNRPAPAVFDRPPRRAIRDGAGTVAVLVTSAARDGLRHEIEYGHLFYWAPVFMGAGAADKDVNPALQMKLAKAACAAGSRVEAHLYEGLDHSATVNGSLKDSLPFVRKALAGEPIAARCDATPEPPK